MKRTFILVIAAVSLLSSGALAQWVPNGVACCTAGNYQQLPVIVSDGAGGAIITWEDQRGGDWDIYAQRVDANGVPLWTSDGVVICAAIGAQHQPAIVSDGSGGAVITWYDFRSGNYDIYSQRVNSLGARLWTADGVAICGATSTQWYPTIAADGMGGAVITWQDYRSGTADIYAQRVNAAGSVQWTADGDTICGAAGMQWAPVIVPDGAGGTIITWYDSRAGNYDIYTQRVNAAGAVQWAANGVAVCTAANSQLSPAMIPDGQGGAVIAWHDQRSGYYDIYAQRVNAAGTMQWTANGVAISAVAVDQQNPTIVPDGSGGAIIAWQDSRNNTDYNIYTQRVDASGAPLWTANGVAICASPGEQTYPTTISDGLGGAIITWQDQRSGGSYDIYAQRVDRSGTAQWAANGAVVCPAPNAQYTPTIVADGVGGAVITWYDDRNSDHDIYAQRIDRLYGDWWGRNEPGSIAISDIPNDQGGKVNVTWSASARDVMPDTFVSFYSVWRSMSGAKASDLLAHGIRPMTPEELTLQFQGPGYRVRTDGGKTYAWEWLANLPSHYLPVYSYMAVTPFDSVTGNTGYVHFMVSAQTRMPSIFWDSDPDSGYSVDNLAPAKVKGLCGQAVKGLMLVWKKNTENDLRDYAVFRNGGFVDCVPETTYTFTGTVNMNDRFFVAAYDIHGNRGPESDPWVYTGVAGAASGIAAPTRDALNGACPNPFRRTTSFHYQLAKPSHILLRVFNVNGQLVKTVAEGQKQPGYYTVNWDGRDMQGKLVADGMYLYTLTLPSGVQTKKVLVLH